MTKSIKVTKLVLFVAIVILATVAFAAEGDPVAAVSYAAIGKGLAIGLGILGTGVAQSAIGAAALGAVVEDRRNFGTALLFFLLPETLAIFGLAFSFLIN
jgi:V/A-type H+/Na+-transporting ATPase subunit K